MKSCLSFHYHRALWPTSLDFLKFFFGFPFSPFLSFLCSFWPPTGLTSKSKLPRYHHRDGKSLAGTLYPSVVERNSLPSFSLKCLSFFVHMSRSTSPIPLIRVSSEIYFASCFVITSEVGQRTKLVTGDTGVNGLTARLLPAKEMVTRGKLLTTNVVDDDEANTCLGRKFNEKNPVHQERSAYEVGAKRNVVTRKWNGINTSQE